MHLALALLVVCALTARAEWAMLDTPMHTYCAAYNAAWTSLPEHGTALSLRAREPLHGCTPPAARLAPHVALAVRGVCAFADKAVLAERAGAVALVVVSNTSELAVPAANASVYAAHPLPLAVVAHEHLDALLQATTVALYAPQPPAVDPSVLVLGALATVLVAVGAIWSAKGHKWDASTYVQVSRAESAARDDADGVALSPVLIGVYITGACLILAALYFFYTYVVYVMLAFFCLAAVSGLTLCLLLVFSAVSVPAGRDISLGRCGRIDVRTMVCLMAALVAVVVWFAFRHHANIWLMQNVIGCAIILSVFRALRIPSLKVLTFQPFCSNSVEVATIFLMLFFLYDIFFVFITPLLTKDHTSVMVKVATGGDGTREKLPLVLLVPHATNPYSGICEPFAFSILGFGDIVLPGLLVAFCLDFDIQHNTWKKKLYYITTLVAYLLGLALTFVALAVTRLPQPALLYLVPSTLGAVSVLGWRRGELRLLWSGTMRDESSASASILTGLEGDVDLSEVDLGLDDDSLDEESAQSLGASL